jgi:xanthine dehydrogenase accessory factor
MKDLLATIIEWTAKGKPFALARVIKTWGSSPRPAGSAFIVSENGEMAGSVSGGCVEGAVLKEAMKIIASHAGKRLSYGVSDEEAWTVGLTCGGKIEVYLQTIPVDNSGQGIVWKALLDSLAENRPGVMITSLINGESQSAFIDADNKMIGGGMPREVIQKAGETLSKRKNEILSIGDAEYFIHTFPKRSLLLVIGAAHITSDLVRMARDFDFETIVIDPRGAFARQIQFAEAPDQIIESYPSEFLSDFTLDSNTYAVILSHDPKIDDDALRILLRSRVAYIGALGSRKTHEKRIERLRQSGFSEEDINRIESPIGVEINARGAKEIALSIMASLIKTRSGS